LRLRLEAILFMSFRHLVGVQLVSFEAANTRFSLITCLRTLTTVRADCAGDNNFLAVFLSCLASSTFRIAGDPRLHRS
jgi:hypothetical protein